MLCAIASRKRRASGALGRAEEAQEEEAAAAEVVE